VTDTLTTPAAPPYEADSPLAELFDIAQAVGVPTDDEQRDNAETAAAHHVWNQYADTFGRALNDDNWVGRPALKPNGLEPSAIIPLGGGLWLHHTLDISERDGARDVLTLLAPCNCGRGYLGYELDGEDDLLQILTDLRRTSGRVTHDGDSGGAYCDSLHPPQPTTR